jgi:hypothetical protein
MSNFTSGEDRWRPYVTQCYRRPATATTAAITTAATVTPTTATATAATNVATSPLRASTAKPVSEVQQVVPRAARTSPIETVVVLDPPLNYTIVFGGPAKCDTAAHNSNGNSSSNSGNSSETLALFAHKAGATNCAGLYEHFAAADGNMYHMYRTSSNPCDAFTPGRYVIVFYI